MYIYIYIYTYYDYLWTSSCITYLLVYTVDLMPGDPLQGCSSDSDNASERAATSITMLELTVRGEDTYRCWAFLRFRCNHRVQASGLEGPGFRLKVKGFGFRV